MSNQRAPVASDPEFPHYWVSLQAPSSSVPTSLLPPTTLAAIAIPRGASAALSPRTPTTAMKTNTDATARITEQERSTA